MKKRKTFLLGCVGAAVCVWLCGDLIYSLSIKYKLANSHVPHASTDEFLLNPDGAPAVLMIHGFADGPAVFRFLAPALAEAGFCTKGIHVKGFGRAPEHMKGVRLSDWQEACDAALDELHAADPGRPVWLLGHSLGGTLAMDAALRHPEKVAGIVLLAPLIKPSDAKSPLLSPRAWFTVLSRFLVFTSVVESRLPKDINDFDILLDYETDRFIHKDLYRALFDAVDAIQNRPDEWKGPLYVAISPKDRVVDTEATTSYFFAATNVTAARLSERHASGHVLPLDFGHALLERQVIDFIRKNTPPPDSAQASGNY